MAQRPHLRSHLHRDDAIRAQFEGPGSAANYAAAHVGSGSAARFFADRIALTLRILNENPSGALLDVGCGPGILLRALLSERPHAYQVSVVDRSSAMVEACLEGVGRDRINQAAVGRAESLPFADGEFDVVLALGVIEYTAADAALAEIARVTRPDGLVLVSMLNPSSPYRFVEFNVFWPLLRLLRTVETRLSLPGKRHAQVEHGIHAYRGSRMRWLLRSAGLKPSEAAYFDARLVVPPFDRFVRRSRVPRPSSHANRGWRKWLSTAYLIPARKFASTT